MSMDRAIEKTAAAERIVRLALKEAKNDPEIKNEAEWVTLIGFMIICFSVYKEKRGADRSPAHLGGAVIEAMGIIASKMGRDCEDYYGACVHLDSELN